MLSFDQIQRELKAIVEFDQLFITIPEHCPEEWSGYECRVLRKIELLDLTVRMAARN
jgi:hypothetical protein